MATLKYFDLKTGKWEKANKVYSVEFTVEETPGVSPGDTPEEIPDLEYVKNEADRVAADVVAAQNSNTFTFIATSDIHYSLDSSADLMESFSDDLGSAVRYLRSKIAPDFEADLGDKVFGATAYTDEDSAREAMVVVEKLGYAPIRLECLGNHDTHNTTVEQRAMFTAGRNRGAVYGDEVNGYCYRDIGNTRVIVLNTSEMGDDTYSSAITMSQAQLSWLCSVLLETASMSGHHILFLSHMPPDWGVLGAQSELLKILIAYEKGGNYTFNNGGLNEGFSFNIEGRPDIIGWAHGHLHNHKHRTIDGTNVWRFCIPGALKTRANEYSNTGDYPDPSFQELFGNETLTKGEYVMNTATSTAFSVVVVDPVAKIITIVNYGPGGAERNRVINYGTEEVYYGVFLNLTNVSSSNKTATVKEGASYTTMFMVTSGELAYVNVTMDGVDITEEVYSDGVVNIPSVTGNVIITANALSDEDLGEGGETGGEGDKDDPVGTYTNLVPTSVSPFGTGVYNGVGYKDGTYVTGINDGGQDAACVATGLIWLDNDVEAIYIKGAKWDASSDHVRLYVVPSVGATTCSQQIKGNNNTLANFIDVTDYGDNYYKFALNANGMSYLRGRYYCISLVGTGENLIITHDEPIG